MSPVHEVVVVVGLVGGVISVSGLSRRFGFPAPILLLVAGVVASFVPGIPEVELDPELVLVVLLPPLLYAAATKSSLIDIRRERSWIVQLAVGLVLVTTIVVAAGLHAVVASVTVPAALALGAVVAPPDAVAATAVARRTGLSRRALTILEGESLFNDATALVVLGVALEFRHHSINGLEVVGTLFYTAAVGLAVGAGLGLALSLIRRNVADTVTDSALSLTAPFVAFIVAEALGASGVVAVVVTGLVSAHRAPLDQDPRARLVESATWATVQFVLEGVVFALVGLQLRTILTSLDTTAAELVASSAVVLGLTIAVRPAWIFATTWLRWLAHRRVGDPPRWRALAVVSWAGMRGVVSLAAALALPNDIPRRDLLVMLTFVVIVGTLVLQGLSLPSVIRRLGIEPPDPRLDALREAGAVDEATNAALARLHTLTEADPPPAAVVQRLERLAELKVFIAWERLGASANGEPPTVAYGRLRREMLTAERRAFVERRDRGELDDDILRRVERDLDLEEALLDSIERDRRPESSMLEELIPGTPSNCEHLRRAPDRPRPTDAGCQECLVLGWEWVHLRQCLDCGHVGCCDSSRGRHADDHFHQTGHPVMRSAEPGEAWRWCYVDHIVG